MAKSAAAREATGASRRRAGRSCRAFDYEHVRLLPSRFLRRWSRRARSTVRSPTTIFSRVSAARPACRRRATDMKGWCKASSAVIFGQLLSGMVRLGRATGDRALIDKAIALFEGWAATARPGRQCPDAGLRLGQARLRPRRSRDAMPMSNAALPTLRATVGWASRTFDRARKPADGHDFWGAGPGDTSEWYTLTRKPLPRLSPLRRSAVQGVRRRLALRGLLARLRRIVGAGGSPSRPRLQPRQLLFERRRGLSRHRRRALSERLPQRLRFHPANAMLRHRRLRPRRAPHAARWQPRPLARPLRLSRGDSLRLLGRVQAVDVPDGLHRRGALRRLDRDDTLQRHGSEPPSGAGRQDLLLRRLPRLRAA